jgi:hypothetical protein
VSSTRKRNKIDPIEQAVIRRALRCPDCPAAVRVERDALGDLTGYVTHAPTCPRIPAEQRARGENMFMIIDPQLIDINPTEEDAGDRRE